MEVYFKGEVLPGQGIFYIHIFTGHYRASGWVTVKDSILKIGLPNAYFTPKGEKIFMGTKAPMELEEAIWKTVKLIFDWNFPKEVMVHG